MQANKLASLEVQSQLRLEANAIAEKLLAHHSDGPPVPRRHIGDDDDVMEEDGYSAQDLTNAKSVVEIQVSALQDTGVKVDDKLRETLLNAIISQPKSKRITRKAAGSSDGPKLKKKVKTAVIDPAATIDAVAELSKRAKLLGNFAPAK